MSPRAEPLSGSFSARERALIRQEMSEHFGQHPLPQSQTDPRRGNPYLAGTGRFAPACGASDSPGPNPGTGER
jgi:hypothetical protein